jgi:hypothetical protein
MAAWVILQIQFIFSMHHIRFNFLTKKLRLELIPFEDAYPD